MSEANLSQEVDRLIDEQLETNPRLKQLVSQIERLNSEGEKIDARNWQPTGRRKQLVDFLISKGFEFSYQYAPNQRTILIFHYDQGAYKGKNVYSRRYAEFDAYMVAGILLGEQLMMEPIEHALNGVFGIGGVSVSTPKDEGGGR